VVEFPEIGDVRGLGLMIGIEFMRNSDSAPDIAARVQRRCVERDLLLLTCGVDDNVIRLLPPLTIGEDDLDAGLDILEDCVRQELGR
jgi:4-aminobutyrate aminotransferase-like enzyme